MTSHEVEVAELRAMLEEKDAVIRSLHAMNDDLNDRTHVLSRIVALLGVICIVSGAIGLVGAWI